MNILQVSTSDAGGGAEGSALNLFRAYRDLGHDSSLVVGRKQSDDPDIHEIPRPFTGGPLGRGLQWMASKLRCVRKYPGPVRRVARWLEIAADPQRRHDWRNGIEDFNFPGTRLLPELPPSPPDVIHCHNLHGWYFDLRLLPELSSQFPVILNLRDAWLLTGHCSYSMDCERWQVGCGQCPYLNTYPAVRRDATRENWSRKADVYARSRLYVTAPSEWLLGCARNSMLGARDYRLIPNGIDLSIFRPADRQDARRKLGLPPDAHIALFASASGRSNIFKDYATVEEAIGRFRDHWQGPSLLPISVGRGTVGLRGGIRHVGYVSDPAVMRLYYSAADVYLHAARAEAFGKTVTEAMACGTPVIATAVGGIPDQVIDGRVGFLTAPGSGAEMAARLQELLADAGLRLRLGTEAAERGRHFGLERQVRAFLAWYEEILDDTRRAG